MASENCAARRFGAVLRQAACIAFLSDSLLADLRFTLVAPRRPQEPFTGRNTAGSAFEK
jgi:hypothetical protein